MCIRIIINKCTSISTIKYSNSEIIRHNILLDNLYV